MTNQTKTLTLPHVVVCPGAGVGHLLPFLRLASMLAATNTCRVTLTIIRPTLSTAETTEIDTFLATHPQIALTEFHALPCKSRDSTMNDPFFLQYDAINRSAHLLVDHLASLSPRPSAVFSDFLLASGISKRLAEIGMLNFTVMTTSARFFAMMVSLLKGPFTKGEDVILPGVAPIRSDEPPPVMYNSEHPFVRLITTNVIHLPYSKGILINTFDYLEPDSISALQTGQVFSDLPPLFPIGPLHPVKTKKGSHCISWLDKQPAKSVVYVSFGSRTAMEKEQIRELGEGLKRGEIRFLWVIKTTIVDKEDKEELNNLLGETFFQETKDRGLVLKEWVNQEEILSHPSIGGFLTHCGWNSVAEGAQRGMPFLGWPLGGDQRVNASVTRDVGLGIWDRRWGQGGVLITADEIKDKIKELMTSDKLRISANKVGDEAKKAWESGGSSSLMFNKITDIFTNILNNVVSKDINNFVSKDVKNFGSKDIDNFVEHLA